MNFINSNLLQSIGWTLLHSLWQSVVIALIAAFIIYFIPKRRADLKHLVTLFSMLSILLCTVITFGILNDNKMFEQNIQTQIIPIIEVEVTATKADFLTTVIYESDVYFTKHMPVIVSIWMIFVIILSLKFILKITLSHRIKNIHKVSLDRKWHCKVEQLSKKLNIKKIVGIYESSLVNVPCVVGFIKPIILLPLSTINHLSVENIEMILLHELSHIKRNDYIINIFQTVLDILFFYNPAYRWISEQARIERELACDDMVILVSNDALTYAKTLALVENSPMSSNADIVSLTITGNKKSLKYRIKRLFNKEEKITYKSTNILSLMFVIIFMTTGLFAKPYPNIDKNTTESLQTNLQKLNAETVTIQRTVSTGLFSDTKVNVQFTKNKLVSVTLNGKNLSRDEFYKYESYLTDEIESQKRFLKIKQQRLFLEEGLNFLKSELIKGQNFDTNSAFEVTIKDSVLYINGVEQDNILYEKYKEISNKYPLDNIHSEYLKIDQHKGYINIKTTINRH